MGSKPALDVLETPEQPLGVRQAANRRKGLRIASSVAADACDRLMEIVGKFFYGQE